MTPIAGLVLAIVAGWTLPRAVAPRWVVAPWIAVLAVQTGWLAAGRGHDPARTVTHFPQVVGYLVVQTVSLALAFWVAAMLADRRSRRRDRAAPVDLSSARSRVVAVIAAAAISLGYAAATAPAHPGHGGGSSAAVGMIAFAACVLMGVGLAILRRAERTPTSTNIGADASAIR